MAKHLQRMCVVLVVVLSPTIAANAHGPAGEQKDTTSAPLVPLQLLIDMKPLEVTVPMNKAAHDDAVASIQEIAKNRPGSFEDLFVQSLGDFQKITTIKEVFATRYKTELCRKAWEEKKAWHEANSDEFPAAFGKMFNYGLREHSVSDDGDLLWTGEIQTCAWMLGDEYYFHLKFDAVGMPDQLRAVRNSNDKNDPFPGTLNIDGLPKDYQKTKLRAAMRRWDWKLHATGKGIIVITALKNGMPIPDSDKIFDLQNCFDIFFAGGYPQDMSLPPSQFAYCMGRCDSRILNTP